MNLVKLALAVEKWSSGHAPVTVSAERCLHAKNKASTCDICVQACPTEAITVQDQTVQLNPDACIRCGLCLHDCPTGVFAGDDGAYKLLRCVSELVDHEVVEIACKHHPAPGQSNHKSDAVITTNGCLSMLSPAAYLALAGLGVKRTVVRLDACAECPLGAMRPKIEEAIQTAETLAEESVSLLVESDPPQGRVKARQVYSVNNPPVSRRGLFRMMALQGASRAEELLSQFSSQTDQEAVIPAERRRVLAALAAQTTTDRQTPVPDLSFTTLSVSDACTASALCARVCPTGALRFYESKDEFSLEFLTADCTNCGLCLSMCAAHAIERSGSPTIADVLSEEPVTLIAGGLKHCQKCHAPFRGEGEFCRICSFRHDNPFGFVAFPRP